MGKCMILGVGLMNLSTKNEKNNSFEQLYTQGLELL